MQMKQRGQLSVSVKVYRRSLETEKQAKKETTAAANPIEQLRILFILNSSVQSRGSLQANRARPYGVKAPWPVLIPLRTGQPCIPKLNLEDAEKLKPQGSNLNHGLRGLHGSNPIKILHYKIGPTMLKICIIRVIRG
jgi:hypothetical protein